MTNRTRCALEFIIVNLHVMLHNTNGFLLSGRATFHHHLHNHHRYRHSMLRDLVAL
jgi:hypothetical protein